MALAAPVLAAPDESPARRSLSVGRAIPLYWHLLSLDAPTVAVLWAWGFARAVRLPQAPGEIAVLGVGTWLIYVFDRILDARPAAGRDNLRERHFFHARHRGALLAVSACALPILLWLISALMPRAARREDAILFSASMLYFGLVHIPGLRRGARGGRTFSRECTVGVIFALGTAVPAWSQSAAAHGELILPVSLFGALCSLNCIAIENWEQPRLHSRLHTVAILAGLIGLASSILMLATRTAAPGVCRLGASILLAATLLWGLDHHARRARSSAAVGTLALRIAADAVLLTPLLFVLPWRV